MRGWHQAQSSVAREGNGRQNERQQCPDAVEKVDLIGAFVADSVLLKHGRTGDDGAEAGCAGRVVL